MPTVFKDTPDKDNQLVAPVNPQLPDKENLVVETNKAIIPETLKRPETVVATPSFPQKSFVESKLPSIADGMDKSRKFDPEFEKWMNEKVLPTDDEIALGKQAIQDKQKKFGEIVTKASEPKPAPKMGEDTTGGQAALTKADNVRKQAVKGVLDFADSAMGATIDLANVSRKFFGIQELDKGAKLADMLPEPTTPAENFTRSAAKFMTGMLPISSAVRGMTGITGIANSATSAGIYGFLFEDDKADSVVTDFLKENTDLADPVLSYLNHDINDSEFQRRLKNGANFVIDDLAMEGIFHGMKYARNKWKGKEAAYKILENGDIEVKATSSTTSEADNIPSFFGQQARESKVAGLTTKETEPLSDTLQKEMNRIKELTLSKQSAVPDRMKMGRDEALAQIANEPISIAELIKMPENSPVNNITVMKAEIARESIDNTASKIISDFQKGKVNEVEAAFKLKSLAAVKEKLTFPRSTSGRALESAKFISNLETQTLEQKNLKYLTDLYGNDAKSMMEELSNMKDGKVGLPLVDTLLTAQKAGMGSMKRVVKRLQIARVNWMLSNPTTHMTNILSTGANLPLRAATIKTAEGISSIRKMVYGDKYLAIGVQQGEARAAVRGYFKGLNAVTQTIKDNMNTFMAEKDLSSPNYKAIFAQDSNTKYNLAFEKQMEDSTAATNIQGASPLKQFAYYAKEIFTGTPVGKMLSYEDDAFKGIVFHSEIERQIHVMEMKSAYQIKSLADSGASAESIQRFTDSETSKFTALREGMTKGNIPKEIEDTAVAEANKWTFNSELTAEDPLGNVLQLGENFRDKVPLGRWFVPFYRTGANIIQQTMDYTPVLGTMVKSGQFGGLQGLAKGGKDADMFLAKQSIGAMVMASAATMYSVLEDQYGADFEMTSLKNNKLGIRLGDFSTSVDKQNPIAKIIFAARDIMDISQVAKQEEGASAAAMAAASMLAELFSPEQLITTMNALTDIGNGKSDQVPYALTNLLKSTLQSTITPYSGAANFVQKDILGADKVNFGSEDDGAMGLMDEMMGRIKQTYLGNEAGLPKRRGLFGQEIPYLRTFEFDVSDNAHDMFSGYNQGNAVVTEIMRLTRQDAMANPANYDQFMMNNTTFIKMPNRTIHLPASSKYGDVYELSPQQYSDYVQYSAGIGMKATLEDSLNKLISSKKYKEQRSDSFKLNSINLIIRAYRKMGQAQLLKDDPAILQEAIKSMEAVRGELNDY